MSIHSTISNNMYRLAGVLLFGISEVVAASEIVSGEWSFSLLYGFHAPSLTELNSGLYKMPVIGEGKLQVQEEAAADAEPEEKQFRFDNDLSPSSYGGKAAFELQWHPNPNYSLLFGFGSWERTTSAKQYVNIPTQLILSQADFERRAKLTYTELTIGGSAVVLKKPKYSVYLRGSIHEVFDIDYREDLIFNYFGDDVLKGNERLRTLEAQTAGLVMGKLAIGSEWYIQKWVSVGVEAGYLKSERNVQLRGAVKKNDFTNEDEITFSGMPYGTLSDGREGYLALDKNGNPIKETVTKIVNGEPVEEEIHTYKRMRLDFSGWQVLFRVNIYY